MRNSRPHHTVEDEAPPAALRPGCRCLLCHFPGGKDASNHDDDVVLGCVGGVGDLEDSKCAEIH